MRIAVFLPVLLTVCLVAAPVPAAFDSVEGTWWFRTSGGDGVVLLELSEEEGAWIPVTGAGWSTTLGGFFEVDDTDLEFDYRGCVTGELDLSDLLSGEFLGTLEITAGKVGSARERICLKGKYFPEEGPTKKVTLRGGRLPETLPAWTGSTHGGWIRGGGYRSRKYDLDVSESFAYDFPFLELVGEGPCRIDGEEESDLLIGGLLLAAPDGRLFGEIAVDFDTGTTRGRVRTEDDVAVLRLRANLPDRRRVRIGGRLE